MLRALLSGERATQPPCGLVLRWGRYGIVLVLPAKPQEGGRGRSLDMRGGVEPPISIVHRKVPVRPRLVPGSPCTSLCRARADSAAPAWVDPAQGPKDGDLNRVTRDSSVLMGNRSHSTVYGVGMVDLKFTSGKIVQLRNV
ncbi:hypothetical protein E2562_038678 [Oryza meyeriana var. granulata]|uniref:Uncharacterized protein n=1 Tax=Oryza meyeriana var. granulata TaxID=110450 RepID=A0A6G1CKP2_9ORYZ|nr:hypothetical protein E2562_038678 [Oryza meyeriana var. granulata]